MLTSTGGTSTTHRPSVYHPRVYRIQIDTLTKDALHSRVFDQNYNFDCLATKVSEVLVMTNERFDLVALATWLVLKYNFF